MLMYVCLTVCYIRHTKLHLAICILYGVVIFATTIFKRQTISYVFPRLTMLKDLFHDELEMSSQVNMDTESHVAEALELPSQLTRRVDALHLLSLLLTGSQRGKVQEILAKLHIGPLLSALFEQLLWKLVTIYN